MRKFLYVCAFMALVGCEKGSEDSGDGMVDVLMCLQSSNVYNENIIAISLDGKTRKSLYNSNADCPYITEADLGSDGETILFGASRVDAFDVTGNNILFTKNLSTGEFNSYNGDDVNGDMYNIFNTVFTDNMESVYFTCVFANANEKSVYKFNLATENVEGSWYNNGLYCDEISLTNDENVIFLLSCDATLYKFTQLDMSVGEGDFVHSTSSACIGDPTYIRALDNILYAYNDNGQGYNSIRIATSYDIEDKEIIYGGGGDSHDVFYSPTMNSSLTQVAFQMVENSSGDDNIYVGDYKSGVVSNVKKITDSEDEISQPKFIRIKKSLFNSLPDAEEYDGN